MKIVVVSLFPNPEGKIVGGVQAAAYYISNAMLADPELRCELEIVTPSCAVRPASGPDHYQLGPLRVTPLYRPRALPVKFHILCYQRLQVRRELRARPGDLVHFHNSAWWAHGVTDRPHLITLYGVNERDTTFRGYRLTAALRSTAAGLTEGRARRRIRNVISTSRYLDQFLADDSRQRVWLIENPIEDTFFTISAQPVKGRILTASTVCARKNVLGLIRAFAELRAQGMASQLRIAGSGADSAYGHECRRLAVSLGVSSDVVFLGGLSVSAMRDELAKAECFGLVSFQETAPLAISEAMAAGVPSVASNLCGIPWMIENGKTGWLVDPHDTASIVDGFRRVLQAPNRMEMGRIAHLQAMERFRASTVARRTFEVYQTVLG